MFRVIPDLIELLGQYVPPWALALVALALVPIIGPAWFRYVRGKRVKNRMRKAFRTTDPSERQSFEDQAFAVAGDSAPLVLVAGDTALSMGLRGAARRAVARLAELDALPLDRARLDKALSRERKQGGHPVQEAVVVERMLNEGLLVGARERLDLALARFPGDSELEELQARLESAERSDPEVGQSS